MNASVDFSFLRLIIPELVLSGLFLLLLLVKLWQQNRTQLLTVCMLFFIAVAIVCVFAFETPQDGHLLRIHQAGSFFRVLILVGGILTTVIYAHEFRKKILPEFYLILLGLILGACMLSVSKNVLLFILSVEVVSLCGYLLVGLHQSASTAEGSLKYFLFGALCSAIMIFGFALLAGEVNSLCFADFANMGGDRLSSPALRLGYALVMAGVLFKLSVIPFHAWTPDVFAASSWSVLSCLTAIPKIAMLGGFIVCIQPLATAMEAFHSIFIISFALLSMGLGTFAALYQSRVKRLIAWSSIAQSGFLLMGLLLFDTVGSATLCFYVAGYVSANYIVILALLQIQSKDDIAELAGDGKMAPLPAFCLTVGLFSLVGFPPLIGFMGKLFLFSALWGAYVAHREAWYIFALIVSLLLTAVSVFYYCKLPYYLYLKLPSPQRSAPVPQPWLLVVMLIVGGFLIYGFASPGVILDYLNP